MSKRLDGFIVKYGISTKKIGIFGHVMLGISPSFCELEINQLTNNHKWDSGENNKSLLPAEIESNDKTNKET